MMLLHRGTVVAVAVWLGIITTAVCERVRLECTKGCVPASPGVTGYKGGSVTLKVVVDDSICVLEIKYAGNLIVHTYEPDLCRLDIRPVPKYDSRLVFDNYLRRVGTTFVYQFTLTNLQLEDAGKKVVYTTNLKDDQGNIVQGSKVVTVLVTTPPPPSTTPPATTQPPPQPVDGNWGKWVNASCSVTCGTGLTSRYRKCDNPPPQNGGQKCPGPGSVSAFCQRPTCPVPPTTTPVPTTLAPTTTPKTTIVETTVTPITTTTATTAAPTEELTTQAFPTTATASTSAVPLDIVEDTTKLPATKPDTEVTTSGRGVTTTKPKIVKVVSTAASFPDDGTDKSTKDSVPPVTTTAPQTPPLTTQGSGNTDTVASKPTPSPTTNGSSNDEKVAVEMQRGDGSKESTGTITAVVIVGIGLVAIVIVICIVKRNKRERLRKYDGVGDTDEEKLQPIREEKCDSSTTDTSTGDQPAKSNPAYPLDEEFLEREGIVKC